MMKHKWTVLWALLAAVLVFAIQNYQVVRIEFLFWSFSTSKTILILLTLAAGLTAGWLIRKR